MTIIGETPLCSSCLQIFSSLTEPSSSTSGLGLAHHHSIASLKQAVEARCPICVAVAAALPPKPISLSLDENATSFNITKRENKFRIIIFIHVNDSNRPVFFNAAQGLSNSTLGDEVWK